jgi:acyl-CoA synthetase (AMP-forming)/AMP-acid ligase II
VSYRELLNACLSVARKFGDLDDTGGSRVAICCDNHIEHVIALLGVLAAGKIWVPLNPRNGDGELDKIIALTSPSIVIVDQANYGRLVEGDFSLLRIDGFSHLSEVGASEIYSAPLVEKQAPEQTLAIKFTGGTTGQPKGVMQPLRAWNCCIISHIAHYGLNARDRFLASAPITHGTSTYLFPLLAVGGAIIIPDETKSPALLDAAQDHAATIAFMPPTLLSAVMDEQRNRPRNLAGLRYLVYSAAPMAPSKIRDARSVFGPIIATSYGQTEAPIIATFMHPEEFEDDRRLGSVGRPTYLTAVDIVDPDGNSLRAGETGEIVLSGDLIMTGYWEAPELSAQVMLDGRLWTGDLGSLDNEGYLYLKGRSREVIITGGFNVYPLDVETILLSYPGVRLGVVFGVEDDKWGEAVHAAIEIEDDFHGSVEDIKAFIRKHLGPVKTPKEIYILEALPKNPVGKVVKQDVKNMIARQL